MTFDRFGRSHHLRIRSAADLESVLALDKAHWVATSAPVEALHFDATFIALMDPDDSKRILCAEVREAVRWALETLGNRDGITNASDVLRLDAIRADSGDGRRIHLAATKMLRQLDLADAPEIALSQVRAIKGKVEEAPVSGAGVVLAEAADDDEIRQFITDVVAALGGVPHPAGAHGINSDQLAGFREQGKAYLEWNARSVLPEGATTSDVLPLGHNTAEAFKVFESLRRKIDQFFAQCRAVALDPRAGEHIPPRESDLASADLADPGAISTIMQSAPLARPNAEGNLSLAGAINPQYAAQGERLRSEVVGPLLGTPAEALREDEWESVKRQLAPYETWISEKPASGIDALGPSKVERYLDNRYAKVVTKLIEESQEAEVVLDNIRLAEKLILYQANLLALVNNFVSFPYLYDPASRAMFEMGTLIMDGRHFTFSVGVNDRARHSKLAKTSDIYVLYATVTPGTDVPPFEVAVPVTYGGKGNLCVGKRGVFEDVKGQQHDAQIVQIIENPISLREALVSPYHRLAKLVGGKIESVTTASEKKLDAEAMRAMDRPASPAAPAAPGLPAGSLLLGGSVAVAALSSAAAYVTRTLTTIDSVKLVAAVVLAILAVILPTSILAIMKLRRRDLSAILEGAGWAINARMRLTFRQGRVFTRQPPIPGVTPGPGHAWVKALLGIAIAVELIIILRLLASG